MRSVLTFFAIFVVFAASAQTDTTSTITVTVGNISSEEGKIYFGLYSAKTFMKAAPEFTESVEITDGTATVTFKNVPEGKYAITAYHDQNGNQMMDFEATGKPKEAYGVSNNKVNLYGPPIWEDSNFDFDGDPIELNIEISR